jgi:hypothetical protein
MFIVFPNQYDLLWLCDKNKQRTWRAAQANAIFLGLAFFSCLLSMAFLFYSVTT